MYSKFWIWWKWESCDPPSCSCPPCFVCAFVLADSLTPCMYMCLYINSVMVMSGMWINSDLPHPCVPLPLLSPSAPLPIASSFIPACLCPPPLYLSPSLTPQPQNGTHNQDLLVCACAVGVSTCFAAPVGGKSCLLFFPDHLRSPVTSRVMVLERYLSRIIWQTAIHVLTNQDAVKH